MVGAWSKLMHLEAKDERCKYIILNKVVIGLKKNCVYCHFI